MCRLLGLAANRTVHLTFSLLQAPNSLRKQSRSNPHGWGIAAFDRGWSVWKNSEDAGRSPEFERRSHDARGTVIISHIRLATVGVKKPENNHPFQFQNWVLAHNGTVGNFKKLPTGDFVPHGDTDSERIFCALLYEMNSLSKSLDDVDVRAVCKALEHVVSMCVRLDSEAKINLLFSDGRRLYVFRHRRPLYWLIRTGAFASMQSRTLRMLEAAKSKGENAVLVATEKLTDERWKRVDPGILFYADPGKPEAGLQRVGAVLPETSGRFSIE